MRAVKSGRGTCVPELKKSLTPPRGFWFAFACLFYSTPPLLHLLSLGSGFVWQFYHNENFQEGKTLKVCKGKLAGEDPSETLLSLIPGDKCGLESAWDALETPGDVIRVGALDRPSMSLSTGHCACVEIGPRALGVCSTHAPIALAILPQQTALQPGGNKQGCSPTLQPYSNKLILAHILAHLCNPTITTSYLLPSWHISATPQSMSP